MGIIVSNEGGAYKGFENQKWNLCWKPTNTKYGLLIALCLLTIGKDGRHCVEPHNVVVFAETIGVIMYL
jgi:hypothetical protein